jgi:hypothetical protein
MFEGMIQGKIAAVEKKLLSFDKDHDGVADLAKAKALAEEAGKDLAFLEAKLADPTTIPKLDAIFSTVLGPGEAGKILGALAKIMQAEKLVEGILPEIAHLL